MRERITVGFWGKLYTPPIVSELPLSTLRKAHSNIYLQPNTLKTLEKERGSLILLLDQAKSWPPYLCFPKLITLGVVGDSCVVGVHSKSFIGVKRLREVCVKVWWSPQDQPLVIGLYFCVGGLRRRVALVALGNLCGAHTSSILIASPYRGFRSGSVVERRLGFSKEDASGESV